MEQTEHDLTEQAARLNTQEEYIAWEQRCDEFIESLDEQSRVKRSRLSIGIRQSLVAHIARLENLKDAVHGRFVQMGAGYSAGLRWREIDTAFESRIMTGTVINFKHIEPHQFLEDASKIVFERVRSVMQEHDNIKINTVFNGEFVAGDKRANKSIATRNYELFQTSDLQEWYESRVIEPTLTSLEEFQDRDSGWALSRILNLIVNMNKYNPLHAGCHIELSREIKLKKAVVNVQSVDNACFAWSVVAALYPTKNHVDRNSSYPHYATVLNLQDIQFLMTLKDITKFERLNNVSINIYGIEEQKVLPIRLTDPIWLTDTKREKHVNLLYVQDDNEEHFAWIKNLSRLVSSQLNKYGHKNYFCDRYVYILIKIIKYFITL